MKNLNYNKKQKIEPIPLALQDEDDYLGIQIGDGIGYRLVSFRNQDDGSILIKLWTGSCGMFYELVKEDKGACSGDIVYRLQRK